MTSDSAPSWLSALRRYVATLLVGHLFWEIAQLPLYTLWRVGTRREIAFAVVHCTAGDLLIGVSTLVIALIVFGDSCWPQRHFARVAAAVVALGLLYTIGSEWINVEVRATWAYADAMPRLPWLGTGLAPLAQWIAVPMLAFWSLTRSGTRAQTPAGSHVMNSTVNLPRHAQSEVAIVVAPAALFEFVDDPRRLGGHMEKSSWMTAGSRMHYEVDAANGRAPGARIRLVGRVLGVALELDEEITERDPPRRKVWATVGTPRLLVIGPYRMGFEIVPRGAICTLRVFIDYTLPRTGASRGLGLLLGDAYARWCVRTMARDAARHFERAHATR